MEDSTTREKILKKIRQALIHKTPNPEPKVEWENPVHRISEESDEVTFGTAFTKVGGQFIFCESNLDFLEQFVSIAEQKQWKNFVVWENRIAEMLDQVVFPYKQTKENFDDDIIGITFCEAMVARTGTIMVSSKQQSGRRLVVVPTVHVVLGYTSQLVKDIKDALALIKQNYKDVPSMIASITGPSRTADIEKTLVTGAHGPKEIFVFLIDDKQEL